MSRGRKPEEDPSTKQLEVYELLLKHVSEFGFQPTLPELAEILNVQQPAVRDRLKYLVEKGLLTAAPFKAERCVGFVGLKFLPYRVDADGQPQEAVYDVGDSVITIKKK